MRNVASINNFTLLKSGSDSPYQTTQSVSWKKCYFSKELANWLQRYCFIKKLYEKLHCFPQSICAADFDNRVQDELIKAPSRGNERLCDLCLRKQCFPSAVWGPRWCLRAQLDLDARSVLNGNGRSASIPSVCSPFHHLFWIETAQCKMVWNYGKYWWVFWVFFKRSWLHANFHATTLYLTRSFLSVPYLGQTASWWSEVAAWAELGNSGERKQIFCSSSGVYCIIFTDPLQRAELQAHWPTEFLQICSNLHVQDSHT